MTGKEAIFPGKRFYYEEWIQSQDIVFSILPEFEAIYPEFIQEFESMSRSANQTPAKRNYVCEYINARISYLFNGETGIIPVYCE